MSKGHQQSRREKKRRAQKIKTWLTWGTILVAVAGLLSLLVWNAIRPAQGFAVAIEGDDHVEDGAVVSYISDPPTSGPHYSQPLPAGFYDKNSPEYTDIPYPEGYLVHGLEHGYVVFWYNCSNLSSPECTTLKEQIQSVMDTFSNVKVVAWPWDSIDYPVVMTSWGRMLELPQFDVDAATRFIRVNRTKAPEASAP